MQIKHVVSLTFHCPISMLYIRHIEWTLRSVHANFLSNPTILNDNFNSLNMTGMAL